MRIVFTGVNASCGAENSSAALWRAGLWPAATTWLSARSAAPRGKVPTSVRKEADRRRSSGRAAMAEVCPRVERKGSVVLRSCPFTSQRQ